MMRAMNPSRLRPSVRFGGLLLATLIGLAGCTLPQDESSPTQGYLLDVGTFKPASVRRPSPKTLLITVPKAAPGFDSNRMAYTKAPPKLDYYQDSAWSDAPAKMLLPLLVRVFETANAFKAVVTPPAPGLADLRVDVDVIRLQQEFMSRPSQVRLTARLKVVDLKSGHVLGTQVFEAIEPAPSENAEGAARAANAAVRLVLDEMVAFVLGRH